MAVTLCDHIWHVSAAILQTATSVLLYLLTDRNGCTGSVVVRGVACYAMGGVVGAGGSLVCVGCADWLSDVGGTSVNVGVGTPSQFHKQFQCND